jgi:acyl-CoA dehydrogenase
MFESFTIPDPRQLVALRHNVRRFIDDEIAAGGFLRGVNSWMTWNRPFSERCAAAGFVGMTLPEAYGGHGRSFLERHVVAEELLAAGAPLASHWIADRQSGPQILRHGTESVRRRLLPEIAAGRCSFAIGMSEPDVGSDLASVKTRGEPVDGGFRLYGTKLWTSNADKAEWLIALCRTAPATQNRHAGLTQVLVDLKRGGVTVRPVCTIAGEKDFCEVHFDGYFVPHEEVLGEAGQGWALVMQELVSERSGPDRFLSTYSLLATAIEQDVVGDEGARDVGRAVVMLGALQSMSLAVAAAVTSGDVAETEAVMVKEAGTTFEQDLPEIIRRASSLRPERSETGLEGMLGLSILYSPSFSLRGGTREILRSIVARKVGMR